MYHPCFIVEFKSSKCTVEGAQLRTCRSGAAVAKAMREVKANARIIDGEHDNDDGSFALSVVLVTFFSSQRRPQGKSSICTSSMNLGPTSK